jgi:1-pyrroline-5-carboxylate dehydrogenase
MSAKTSSHKVTYATLSMPGEDLHTRYEAALERVQARLGQTHPMYIDGQPVTAAETFAIQGPIDTRCLLGHFQEGTAQHAHDALSAARRVFSAWSARPWQERVEVLRRAAGLIEGRLYELSALTSLEVGKNRLEAIGDVQEAADLIYYYCDQMEANQGFDRLLLRESANVTNRSVLRPHGVWVVISPFNFPSALSGGPCGAALVAGNTVVLKPASATPYTVYELARCFYDAGLPAGTLNLVTGPGRTLGAALVGDPGVDGITFTGSHEVGMHIYRAFSSGRRARPCIAEMGGKNPAIVTGRADLDVAALGVMRSAFGLQGQKCSACSRVYVERTVKDAFTEKLLALTEEVVVGDPTRREVWMGPVIDQRAYQNYTDYCEELSQAGCILIGGKHLTAGELSQGYFCAPTIVDDLPFDHRLWKQEMFLPILALAAVDNLDEAIQHANDVGFGLTAGLFSNDPEEVVQFLDRIQAGVTYVNRRAGATTGAWPGYQAFGGWKGSGSTGKAAGSVYYVPQYMREQSRTVIDLG